MIDYDIADLQKRVADAEDRLKMLETSINYILYDMEQHEALHCQDGLSVDCLISEN